MVQNGKLANTTVSLLAKFSKTSKAPSNSYYFSFSKIGFPSPPLLRCPSPATTIRPRTHPLQLGRRFRQHLHSARQPARHGNGQHHRGRQEDQALAEADELQAAAWGAGRGDQRECELEHGKHYGVQRGAARRGS